MTSPRLEEHASRTRTAEEMQYIRGLKLAAQSAKDAFIGYTIPKGLDLDAAIEADIQRRHLLQAHVRAEDIYEKAIDAMLKKATTNATSPSQSVFPSHGGL